jgi:hypothetical protein
MSVRFPAPVEQIDFDATINWFAPVDSNCGIAKIRAGFPVPHTELNYIDLVAIGAHELPSEISGKPACLQLQL